MNMNESNSFNESSNTYAFEDLTKVTPYLAPDLLQSTMGAGQAGNSSLHFRLARRRSSLSNQHFVSTPLGPMRTIKTINVAAPVAKFDDDPSFVLTTSLGFEQNQKRFVDASTDAEPLRTIEQKDFSCQIECESQCQEIQTENVRNENVACQIEVILNEFSCQTFSPGHNDVSCQIYPSTNEQMTETEQIYGQNEFIQTDSIEQNDFSTQMQPETFDGQTETERMSTENFATQTSIENNEQEIQTESVSTTEISTQFEMENAEREIQTESISTIETSTQFEMENAEQEIQTESVSTIETSTQFEMENTEREIQTESISTVEISTQFEMENAEREIQTESVSTTEISTQFEMDNAEREIQTESISTIETSTQFELENDEQSCQTDPSLDRFSSSLFILPRDRTERRCSSTIVVYPQPVKLNAEIQCEILPAAAATPTNIPIVVDKVKKIKDRRSFIQEQLDEKEKQMNRIIEEYAILYGEYESERRLNIDLAEARDRLADHIKILSDELGDREISQEKLLIKSCQQNKLINYMLPQIDCSPMPKKKYHSANSLRRLLPKFK